MASFPRDIQNVRECLAFLLGSYSPLFPPVSWVDSLPSSSSFVSLDKLLDAGLYTGEVTEIVGGPGSGKTQVHTRPPGEVGA